MTISLAYVVSGNTPEADDTYSLKIASLPDRNHNFIAQEGCDRCPCGSKYFEFDRCIDCGTHISLLSVLHLHADTDTILN